MADAKPSAGMPLPDAMAGNFQEALRWFNQLWSAAGDAGAAGRAGGPIPSALMPTLDVNELDKRIGDLRSVEHWLQLNLGLLQTTIQGLEMQRNTLAAWQAFGTSAAQAAQAAQAASAPGAAAAAAGAAGGGTERPDPTQPPAFQPALWWSALQQQFAQMAAAAGADAKPTSTASPGDPVATASAAPQASAAPPAATTARPARDKARPAGAAQK